MMKYALLYVFFLFSFAVHALGYDFNDEKLEAVLERIAKNSRQPNILDDIERLMNSPIELSGSSIKAISQIPTVSYSLARDVKELANSHFTMVQIIDSLNLDEDRAYMLFFCSYIDIHHSGKKQREYLKSRTRIIEQMNRLKGFELDKYQGSRTDIYQRILGSYSGVSAGALFSKDLGEKYEHSFLSGFISYSDEKFNISIGDYYVQCGLGNILWSQNTMGKGADVISPAFDFDNSVKDYKSASEYGYFRGITLSNRFQFSEFTGLNISAWVSNTKRAAAVDTNNNIITSIYKTGYFRTESEISKIDNLNEQTVGGNLTLLTNDFNIGVNGYYLDYDKTVETSSSGDIYGKNAFLKSIYAFVPIGSFSISTEASADGSNNPAIKLIGEYKQRDYVLIMHLRSFSPEFRSPFGFMFGEQSNPNNEYGLYSGFLYKGFDRIKISTYIDFFGSYERTYYVPEPIHGIDILNETIFKLSNGDNLKLRFQYENKTDAVTNDSKTKDKAIFQRSKYYIRADYIHYLTDWLRLRGRLEMNLINFESVLDNETGKSAYLEMLVTAVENLKFTGRFSYFSTESYESALWQYEYLFPGYISSPPLYGNGFRTFLSVNWKPLPGISVWGRYLLMKRYNEETIGSGNNEMYHNDDQRFYIQLDFEV